jgi:hypothetical protein
VVLTNGGTKEKRAKACVVHEYSLKQLKTRFHGCTFKEDNQLEQMVKRGSLPKCNTNV